MNASLCRHGGLSRAVMIHRLWLRNSPSLRIQVIRSLSTVVPHRIQSSLPPPQGHQRTKTNEKLCKKVVDSRHDASPDQKVSSPSPTISSIRTAHMPMSLTFTGDTTLPITSHMHIVTPNEDPPSGLRPVYRLMDEDGEFRDTAYETVPAPDFVHKDARSEEAMDSFHTFLCQSHPELATELQKSALLQLSETPFIDTQSRHTLLRVHQQMIRLRQMDHFLMNAQRQGRISFYMTCTGEEGIHMGAASAMHPQDPVLAQYREQGVLMWRGFSLEQFTNQCFANDLDLGRGRQMPVHYGSKALSYHTVSSPLGTQLPQAVGVAYRLKLAKQPNVPICFFGDGCASTTDFHSAMNFAATLKVPLIFFCRNNGYAISTSVDDQYAGDGIVARGPGYGMASIRVDGNDVFAVHSAVAEARAYALENSAPVLIEGMTYRLGHHSTSDDSSRYRGVDEVAHFKHDMDPLTRLQNFLKKHGLLTSADIDQINEEERFAVLQAMEKAEKRPKPPVDKLFEDVYNELPQSLQIQKEALVNHIEKHPKKYNI